MRQRTITAVFFAAAMIGGIYGGRYTFFILFMVIAAGSLWELGGLLLSKDEKYYSIRKLTGCLMGLIPILIIGAQIIFYPMTESSTKSEFLPGSWSFAYDPLKLMLVLDLILVFLALLFELFNTSKSPFQNIATFVFGIFYIGLPTVLLISLATSGGEAVYHPHRVFGILWLIWTNDTMAYLIGSRIGKTKLFERISPKKTWEGTIGGGLCTIAMAGLISLYIKDFSQTQWLVLGLVVAVFGNLGDLVESMLKRSVGVKDSGSLLPGHGGLLDRFDSFIFILPFAWLVLQLI